MKSITIQYLKQNLSAVLSAAAAGTRFVVTRHRRPVAEIGAAGTRNVHVGPRFGKTSLRPAIQATVGGRYLDVLLDDRAGRETQAGEGTHG